MDINFKNLNRDYLQGKVVPFIGAGLSAPFKVPTWSMLITKIAKKYATGEFDFVYKAVVYKLNLNDYWGAVDQLKDFLNLTDQDIQSEVVSLIRANKITLEDNSKHNYLDIAKLSCNLYLTTNYENLLYEYVKCENLPIQMRDVDFSAQDLFDSKRILHLHGYVSNPGSIVLSRSSYDELYKNDKYENLLKLVTGTKKLLFMGFSFDDQFIRQLIKDHKDYFKGNHYIILDNPSEGKVKELKEVYGLITIKYNSEQSTHSDGIRKILAKMMELNNDEDTITQNQKKNSDVILGAQITDMQQNIEDNLFYKKLQIEGVDSALLDLSSAFYVAAEVYIRELKNSGMSIEVINAVLAKVLITFRERYYDTYKKFGDSEQFVGVVHESLEKINLGRLSKLFSEEKISDRDENRGLIHILADDEIRGIWWGEKRINE